MENKIKQTITYELKESDIKEAIQDYMMAQYGDALENATILLGAKVVNDCIGRPEGFKVHARVVLERSE